MDRDDFDDPLARRRQKRQAGRNNTLLIAGVVAGALALGCGGVALVGVLGYFAGKGGGPVGNVVGAVAGPTPEREGETWTHAELAVHLNAKGVSIVTMPTHHGVLVGPAVYGGRTETELKALLHSQDNRLGEDVKGTVYIQKRATAQDAKDFAGTRPTRAFSWGRFVFAGDDQAYLNQIRTALVD